MKANQPARRFSLRLVVRFHGAVVVDELHPGGTPLRLDPDALGLPLPPEEQLGVIRWIERAQATLIRPDGERVQVTVDAPLKWTWGDVELELSVVPQWQVVPAEAMLDLYFIGAVTAIMLVVMALDAWSSGGPPAAPTVPETSPELIARLLEEDYEGADEGLLYEQKERPTSELSIQDIYLPSGDEGPTKELGGAKEVADARERGEDEESKQARHQPLPPEPAADEDSIPVPQPILPKVEDPQVFADNELGDFEEAVPEESTAEAKEGFGLKDWYGAEDARAEEEELDRKLDLSRELVRINPDSAWALQQLAYYQYLSEDFEACRKTYDRFIELYPEDPAGYNNLALVYKRTGEYAKEEGYYRLALALEPGEQHALTNLALNLAHQQRYDEALAIMDELEAIVPGDPYADLHRSKIYASKGDEQRALDFLERALAGMQALDTLHHIEFRQDIRLDPAFSELRESDRFNELLIRYYGRFGEELRGMNPGGRSG
ncbi:MAG: tetratricopeptide repeat protein [Alphaproteobacteria bacterium]|nr:tetratricopeptide repeat protein [Alphaproteobacteria bacterium]